MYTMESAVIRGLCGSGEAVARRIDHIPHSVDRAIAANESSEWFSAWFRSSLVLMIIKTRVRYLFNKKQANISAAAVAGSEQ